MSRICWSFSIYVSFKAQSSSLISSFPQYFLMTICYILVFNPCFSQHYVSSPLYSIICMVSHIYYTVSSICSLNISKPLTPPYSAAQLSNYMKHSNTFKIASSFSLWEMANKLQWLLLKLLLTDFVSYSWKLAGMQIKLYHTCQTASQLCNQLALQIKNKTCY